MRKTTAVAKRKRKSDGETPEMRIEMWPIDRPLDYPKNARKWSQAAIDKVTTSLREFGFRQPIVVDRHDVIIIGHLRRVAARAAGFTAVPVHVADMPAGKVRQLRLMDNRSHDEAQWDLDVLAEEMAELSKLDLDLSFTGFDEREYVSFMAGSGLTDPDEVPEAPAIPVTQAGDLWLMGDHRLLCGDSTDRDAVARLMNGKRAGLMFTSPPYDQQRQYEGGVSDWLSLMQRAFIDIPVTANAQVLVNLGLIHRDGEWLPYWEPWIEFMRSAGWKRFAWYVWDQGPGLPGGWNGRLAPSHEFIFHFSRTAVNARKTKECVHAGEENHGSGLRAADGTVSGYSHAGAPVQAMKIPDSVFRVMRHKARGIECEHPAVFPIRLAEEVISAFSDKGDVLYEPFCGSGSQIIAANLTKRLCRGMEMVSRYVDVAVTRWQNFTGKAATLDGDGRTFAEIAAERAA